MSTEARTISVHILGQEYRIRSTEDGEFVREVARYVDDLMHRISEGMTAGTKTSIAVLAALNIAEELHRERRNGGSPDAPELEERVRSLLGRLDEVVDEPPRTRKSDRRSRVSAG